MSANNQKSLTKAYSNLITDPAELFNLLELDTRFLAQAYEASKLFALKVPREWIAVMQKGNLRDPLLLQILPLQLEHERVTGYEYDPLKEKEVNPIQGLLHKYRSRVLVTLTSTCAINCRYCFRRHFPYDENNVGQLGWEKIFTYIEQHEEINEVILSGGDPLIIKDDLLKKFAARIVAIKHIKRLRIHTRMPVVMPERITEELLEWLRGYQLPVIIVLHVNHPNELTANVQTAIQELRTTRVVLLNQSVLLKDVNDNSAILTTLSEKLFSIGILPYYLHILDKVQGAAHFDIPLAQAVLIHKEMQTTLPGFLVPKLVREEAGESRKVWV